MYLSHVCYIFGRGNKLSSEIYDSFIVNWFKRQYRANRVVLWCREHPIKFILIVVIWMLLVG